MVRVHGPNIENIENIEKDREVTRQEVEKLDKKDCNKNGRWRKVMEVQMEKGQ